MLQVNKHRLSVWSYRNSCDFASSHAGEDSFDFLGLCISDEHLIVVSTGLRAVRLDEDATIIKDEEASAVKFVL